MIFIPINDLYKSNNELRQKIIFNHENFIDKESFFTIGGLKKLNNVVTLKSGKSVSLHLLLKSIPASEGMSCPQLFQQAEPNSGAQVTIVSFQDQDREVIT